MNVAVLIHDEISHPTIIRSVKFSAALQTLSPRSSWQVFGFKFPTVA